MNWYLNLRLATKLMSAFSVLLCLIGGMAVFSVQKLAEVNSCGVQIATEWLPCVRLSTELKENVAAYRMAILRHILSTTPEEMKAMEQQAAEAGVVFDKNSEEFKSLINSPEGQKLYDELDKNWHGYLTAATAIMDASRKDKDHAKVLADGDARALFRKTAELGESLSVLNQKGATAAEHRAAETYATARLWTFSVLGVSIVTGLTLAWTVARLVSKPLNQMAVIADAVAVGDVNQTITIDTKEELGTLANSFRKIIDAQKELATGASKIAAGDMSVQIVERSEKDVLSKSFQQLQGAIRGLVEETREIVQAANQGHLDKRGDAGKFQGAYRDLVQGFNQTLDAVVEPITEAAGVLDRVAERDLTARVQGQYQGDHAKIKNALNMALDNLEKALGQAAVGAEQVTSAATQISNGAQSLAQGASEQASSLEEISSSLEEMASMTKQNAENSNQGKLLSGEARGAADRGNEAMTRMAGAIDKIKSSSDATAKIIKTIDEIAFQTNLLALNAAVEAARAGEAGKGFAVVAEEVRNLAQRSAEAAKNTANMIEESVKNADGGVRITEEVAKALGEISEASNKVNDLVAEIAAASAEQSKGIEQINLAVNQLDKVTQQNAANSEESASAAEELKSQSQSLSQTVGQFRIRAQAQKATRTVEKQGSLPATGLTTSTKRTKRGAKELVGASAGKSGQFLPLDGEEFAGF